MVKCPFGSLKNVILQPFINKFLIKNKIKEEKNILLKIIFILSHLSNMIARIFNIIFYFIIIMSLSVRREKKNREKFITFDHFE